MSFVTAGQLLRRNEGVAAPAPASASTHSTSSHAEVIRTAENLQKQPQQRGTRSSKKKDSTTGGKQQTLSFKKIAAKSTPDAAATADALLHGSGGSTIDCLCIESMEPPQKRLCTSSSSSSQSRCDDQHIIVRSVLVGRRFHVDGASTLKQLAEDSQGQSMLPVSIEREPNNQYDPQALLVRCPSPAVGVDGSSCGHVPREHAKILSPLVDSSMISISADLSVKSLLESAPAAAVDLSIMVHVIQKLPKVFESLSRLANLQGQAAVSSAARPLQTQRGAASSRKQNQGAQRSLLRNFGRGSQALSSSGGASAFATLDAVIGGAGLLPDMAHHMSIRSLFLFRATSAEWRKAVDALKHNQFRVAAECLVSGIQMRGQLIPASMELHASNCIDVFLKMIASWTLDPMPVEDAVNAVAAGYCQSGETMPTATSFSEGKQICDTLIDAFRRHGMSLTGWQVLALGVWFAPSHGRQHCILAAMKCSRVQVDHLRELVALLAIVSHQVMMPPCRSQLPPIGFGLIRLRADLLFCNRLVEDAGLKLPICGLHMPGVKLTEEQNAIVVRDLKPTEQLVISAFAGTGKTSTLRMYANLRPHLRFLYICFNVSVREEAQRTFPSNVTCKNAHQLAYAKCGFKFNSKLKDDLRMEDLFSHRLFVRTNSQQRQSSNDTQLEHVETVLSILKNFINSASADVGQEHLPSPLPRVLLDGTLSPAMAIGSAKTLWQEMCDVKNDAVKMTHNGYLKLYSLSKPRLSFDVVLLDEAQDCNPAIADIVMSQKCAQILVGDGHQSIYGFLGAMDMLGKAANTSSPEKHGLVYRRQLTRSFRFGPNVADLANWILHCFKGETRPVLGCGKHTGQLSFEPDSTIGSLDGCPPTPFTFVARTNASIVEMALRADEAGLKIGWVGGVKGYRLSLLRDLCLLALGRSRDAENARIRSFKSVDALRNFTRRINDRDSLARIDLVRRHCPETLLARLKSLEAAAEKSESSKVPINQDIHLATVHKAKGLEWDTVMLSEDFPDVQDLQQAGMAQEVNALYVAVTRAVRRLQPSTSLSASYRRASEATSLSIIKLRPSGLRQEPLTTRCPGCGDPMTGGICSNLIGSSTLGATDALQATTQQFALRYVSSIGLNEICSLCSQRQTNSASHPRLTLASVIDVP